MTELLSHIDAVLSDDHLVALDRELDAASRRAVDAPDLPLDVASRGPLVTTLAGLRSPVWYP